MKVTVTDHVSDHSKLYEGDASHIEARILFDYPFLRTGDPKLDHGDLMALLEHLDANQSYEVDVEHDELEKADTAFDSSVVNSQIVQDMLGFEPARSSAFAAAAFLAGREPTIPPRQALWEADGDLETAALKAYGFEVNEANLSALRAVQGLQELSKAEARVPTPKTIEAAVPEGQDVADAIKRAFKDSFVFEVQLAGKHSKGSLLARDEQTSKTWLLKPGSDGTGPAAGVNEDPSTQSAREAAFYHVVKEWGIWHWYPRAELVLMDGHQFAAMELLPWAFKTAEARHKTDPGIVRRTLQPLLVDGTLHKMAFTDAVLGQTDRHGQNVMMDEDGHVRLIDEGSAFAGPDFDPVHDKASFVPYYIRPWAPESFNSLSFEDKMRYLPRVSPAVAEQLKSWVVGLSSSTLGAICHRYGINPAPSLARFAHLRGAISEMPLDLAVNRFWAGHYAPEVVSPTPKTAA